MSVLFPLTTLFALSAPTLAAPRDLRLETLHFAIWHQGERSQLRPLERILSSVQRRHPGLRINLVCFPTADPYHQIQQWCRPGAQGAPDVVVLRDLWLPDFAYALQPLNALLRASDLARFPESVRARLRFAGNLYGVPWTVDARALFYRPDLLTAAGVLPPRTWSELVIAARRAHRPPEVFGFGLPGTRDDGASELLLSLLWAQGEDLPPVEEPTRLDMGKLAAALQLYAELHSVAQPEVLSWDQGALEEFFVQGRLAMIIGDKSLADHLRATIPDFQFGIAPFPAGPAPAGFLSLDLACLLKTSAHRDAAVKLLTALTSREAAEALVEWGSVPFHEEVAAAVRLDTWLAPFADTVPHARGLPPQRWASVRLILAEGLFGLLTGRQTLAQTAELIRQRFCQGQPLRPTHAVNQ